MVHIHNIDDNVLYLKPHTSCTPVYSKQSQYKNNEMFYIFILTLHNLRPVLYLSTSQPRIEAFKLLSSHMWQVAILLGSTVKGSEQRHLDLVIRQKSGKNWPLSAQIKSDFFPEAFSDSISRERLFPALKAFLCYTFTVYFLEEPSCSPQGCCSSQVDWHFTNVCYIV